jgi:hypothetical protein
MIIIDEDEGQEHLEALSHVKLHSFKAEPSELAPFQISKLSWNVSAPDGVSIILDAAKVGRTGALSVQPQTTQLHRLYARSGRYSKALGTLTLPVNFETCVPRDIPLVTELIAGGIQSAIDNDTTGLSFRLVRVTNASGTTFVRSKPQVWISNGRLNVKLMLNQEVDWFPNAIIDTSASFGLAVQGSSTNALNHLVAVDVEVSASVTFPFYAFLIPNAQPTIYLEIAEGTARAQQRMQKMVRDIVGPTVDGDGNSQGSLSSSFPNPPQMEKHSVRLYNDADGTGVMEVTFCPRPSQGNQPNHGGSGGLIS